MDSSSILSYSEDLKVSELLKEVELNYTPQLTKLVDETVSAIKSAIDNVPEDFQVTADVAPGFVRDVGADKVDFKFKRPKSVEVGGSYSIQCVVKPDVNVDVLIRLPKECFHEKDFLNHRYHAKRFLYLCIVKKYLKKSQYIRKVEWSTFQNEARKPVLIVYPALKDDDVPGLYVRIIPTATSLFNISKLKMTRNNIRASKQATAYDKKSEAWSEASPSASELKRLVAYARSTASLLTNLVLLGQIGSYSWESVFRTPLNNYDAVVLLHRDRLAYPQRLLFPSELKQGRLVACGNASNDFHPFMSPGNFKGNFKELKDKLFVDLDPFKCYLEDLKEEFPGSFKVWFDSLGGDAIGLTWERSSSKKRGREDPDDNDKEHVFLLKAVGEVGKGLVRSIYSLKAPRIGK